MQEKEMKLILGSDELIDMGRQGGWDVEHQRLFEAREVQRDQFYGLMWETAARFSELVKAHRCEFDLDFEIWIMPGNHSKTGRARHIPLTSKAVTILKALLTPANPDDPRLFQGLGVNAPNPKAFVRSMKRLGLNCETPIVLRGKAKKRLEKRLSHMTAHQVAKITGGSQVMWKYANRCSR